MKLYHGTSERHLKRILKEGILPRVSSQNEGNWNHTVESATDRVYLTKGYAPYFANCAAEENERWVIIEVDKDKLVGMESAFLGITQDSIHNRVWERFFPDEDYIENMLRGNTYEKVKSANRVLAEELLERGYPFGAESSLVRPAWIRDHIDIFAGWAEQSLDTLGNISWRGVIPPGAMTRVSLYDPKSNPGMTMTALDPTISTINWKICSQKYEEITRWFLGYEVDVSRLTYFTQDQSPFDSHEYQKKKANYDRLLELKEILESRPPEQRDEYIQATIETGDSVMTISEQSAAVNGMHYNRTAGCNVEAMLDGAHTINEVLEEIEQKTAHMRIQLAQRDSWEKELLPLRSGIEVIETAQMGVGIKTGMRSKEEVFKSILEESLCDERIRQVVEEAGGVVAEKAAREGIEEIAGILRSNMKKDLEKLWLKGRSSD